MNINRRTFLVGASAFAGGCRIFGNGYSAALKEARALAREQIANGIFFGAAFAKSDRERNGFVGYQGATPATGAIDGQTRFEVASVTKTITATVAARLVAQGRLDLYAPFTEYFPEHVLAKKNHGIRIFELATHTSSLGGFAAARFSPDPKVNGGWEGFLDGLRTVVPYRAPGKVHYNCMNFCLLAEICHRVTGKPLEVMAREMVFEPLGMTRSAWWPQPDDGHLAHLPLQQQDCLPRKTGTVSDPPALYAGRPIGNAGLYTNLGDLKLFTRDLLERRTFEKDCYTLMHTPLVDVEGQRRSFGWDMTGQKCPKGFSPKTILHTGFTGQSVCIDPENGFAGVVLTNRCTDNWNAANEGRNRILAALACSVGLHDTLTKVSS